MTYVLGPCPVPGCDRNHGVTARPASRSASGTRERKLPALTEPLDAFGGSTPSPAAGPPNGSGDPPTVRLGG